MMRPTFRSLPALATFLLLCSAGPAAAQQIVIDTESLPTGRVGDSYTARLIQIGATSPTWRVVEGALPPGLVLGERTGEITGAPGLEGQFAVRVECSQVDFVSGFANYVVTVNSASSVGLATNALPEGNVGQAYSASLQASGGTPPYAFQLIGGGPGWLFINAAGEMAGTPDRAGNYELSISIIDSGGDAGGGIVNLAVVQPGGLEITTPAGALPGATVNQAYNFQFQGQGGQAPRAWFVESGTLPTGLSLDQNTGVLAGVPTETARSVFVVSLYDNSEASDTVEVSIEVAAEGTPTQLAITVPAQIGLRFGMPANYTLTAEGGQPPYSWQATGDLPPGLSISGDTISGTATASTTTSLILIVRDNNEDMAQKEVSVYVTNDGMPPGRNPNSSGGGRVGGNSRRVSSGCACATPRDGVPAQLALLIVAAGIVLTRRRKRN